MSVSVQRAWAVVLAAVSAGQLSGQDKPFGIPQRVLWTSSRVRGTPDPQPPYRTERAFPKLKFNEPLEMDAAPGTNRLFVAERYGKILSFDNRPDAEQADLFLDLGKVIYGFAFHPKFAVNGFVFVCYVQDAAKEEPTGTQVARFTAKKDDSGIPRCDRDSELTILQWPSGGHNGGCLRFGPDGMLYIATGDSSGIADQLLTGQSLADLSGAILRIDIDQSGDGKNYRIPADNPFVSTPGARGENWAYGLRQPWKMHFDRPSGELWTGNVGQDLWEQIVLVERGGNYGWSVMEGSHPFRPERPRGPTTLLPPVVEHDHAEFRSITGGVVYRGSRLPELQGAYIYGDYDTGKIWMLRYDKSKRQLTGWRELMDSNVRIVGFAEDAAGEFYLIDHMGGGLHRLVPNRATTTGTAFPTKLSETGLFADTARHELAPGVLTYSVNAAQWCDGAVKERYFALLADSRIEFETVTYPQPAPGSLPSWRFPDGTVIAETISLDLEPGDPAGRKRLETRLLHFEQLAGTEEVGDQFWRGYSYVWNDEQTDATLVESAGANRLLRIADKAAPGGYRQQTWRIPSRAECTVCHNMAARYVLGLTTNQVNRDHRYETAVDNQLRAFDHAGLFTKSLPKPPTEMVRLVDYTDSSADLDQRARSYLHANCSHCHRKWGGGNTEFQLLASLPLSELGIAGTKPAHGGFFIADAEILAASDPFRSVLLYRTAKLGPGRMPRLGSEVVDDAGVQLLHDWIAKLPVAESKPRSIDFTRALAELSESLTDAERIKKVDQLISTSSGAMSARLAIDRGTISKSIRALVVNRGTASQDAHIRDLFEKYLPEELRPKRLGNVIEPAALLAIDGNSDRGRQLFFNTAGVQCRSCHQIQGQGTGIGPDLSQVGKKYDRARLLDNILNPSREIDPKFVVFLAETRDGKLYSGLLTERTEKVVILKDAKNQVVQLSADEIEELTAQQQSLMPDLLLRDLTAQQVADLVAFLSELK